MNTNRLYEFLVLSKLLNFSKAADVLYISQSILSRHIQELEAELGVALLTRNTHCVTLTEAGRVLAKEGPELIDKWGNALRRIRSPNIAAQGVIHIGVGLEFSYSNRIRNFTSAFHSRYPDIDLRYDVLSGSTPASLIQGYDLFFTPCAFHDLPEYTQQLFVRKRGTYALLPPDHPLMAYSAVALHQLSGQTIIVPYAQEMFGPYAQNWILAEKATKGQVSIIKVDNLSTALFLVSMGKGICIVPQYVKYMTASEIFMVSISDRNCRFDEYLYYNEKGNSAARLFFEEYQGSINM